jgi:hypothetical protein
MPVAALLGATGGCANGIDPVAAWRDPGRGETDVRRHALAHAILAPSPLNLQPWLVRLVGDDGLELRIDPLRRLPETDPFDRRSLIAAGAFLELLGMAAAAQYRRLETRLWPQGAPGARLDSRPVAEVRFVIDPSITVDPLFAQALNRRTVRDPFDMTRPVEPAELAVLADSGSRRVTIVSTAEDWLVSQLRGFLIDAGRIEMRTPGPAREVADALRIGAAEIARRRDGVPVTGWTVEAGRLLGLQTREAYLRPDSFVRAQYDEAASAAAQSAMAFAWLVTPGNSRADQIEAGRAYLRFALLAAQIGVAIQPWSQPLAEYRAMATLRHNLYRRLGVAAPARIQMLVRLGHAELPPAAPRRGLAAHIEA